MTTEIRELVNPVVERLQLSLTEAQAAGEPVALLLVQAAAIDRIDALHGFHAGDRMSETVARLQGEVELRPRQGPGTVLFLSVPLSIATLRLLLVSCRGQTFAVPVHGIEVRFHRDPPRRFRCEPGGRAVEVRKEGEAVVVRVPPLEVHALLVGEY